MTTKVKEGDLVKLSFKDESTKYNNAGVSWVMDDYAVVVNDNNGYLYLAGMNITRQDGQLFREFELVDRKVTVEELEKEFKEAQSAYTEAGKVYHEARQKYLEATEQELNT